MFIDTDSLKEIISINKEELKGNKELTNELLADEIMLALGYDKKRDSNVKRVFNDSIDWEITDNDKKVMAVIVIGYEDNIRNQSVVTDEILDDYEIVMVTNGNYISLYTKELGKDKSIVTIDILNSSERPEMEVLSYIKKQDYSFDSIMDYYDNHVFTEEMAIETLNNHAITLARNIVDLSGCNITDESIDIAKRVLSKCLNSENTVSSTDLENTGLVKALRQEIAQYENIMKERDIQAKEFQDALDTKENAPIDNKTIEEYRNKIAELTADKYKLQEEVKKITQEMENVINNKLNEKNAKMLVAKELVDSAENDSTYVAVVNTTVIKSNSINKLVGKCLMELYTDVNCKLMPVLFDGGQFIFNMSTDDVDFILNSKSYKLQLDGLSDEDIITKLYKVFQHFENVAFECKVNSVQTEPNQETAEENPDESKTDSDMHDIDNIDTSELDSEDTDLVDGEEIDVTDRNDNGDLDNDNDITSIDAIQFDNIDDAFDNTSTLINVPVSDLETLTLSEDVRLNTIKYVGNNSGKILQIQYSENEAIDKMLTKVIDSILSMCDNFAESIEKLRKSDLADSSTFLESMTAENRKKPRITFTYDVINNIDSIEDCIPIITNICEILGFDESLISVYFDAELVSDEFDEYIVDEATLDISENTEMPDIGTSENNEYAVVTGSITDLTLLTKHSFCVQGNIFEKCIAVKTNYLAEKVGDSKDIVNIVTQILQQGLDNGERINTDAIGKVFGEDYMILSEDCSKVAESCRTINIDNKVYYLSEMEDWQLMYALIKLHKFMCGHKSIGIKVKVNGNALSFYKNEFKSLEPSYSLSVNSLVQYIENRIK